MNLRRGGIGEQPPRRSLSQPLVRVQTSIGPVSAHRFVRTSNATELIVSGRRSGFSLLVVYLGSAETRRDRRDVF